VSITVQAASLNGFSECNKFRQYSSKFGEHKYCRVLSIRVNRKSSQARQKYTTTRSTPLHVQRNLQLKERSTT